MVYSMLKPIDDIFNMVEDLIELTKLAKCSYTPQQQINIWYLIVSKQRVLRDDMKNGSGNQLHKKRG